MATDQEVQEPQDVQEVQEVQEAQELPDLEQDGVEVEELVDQEDEPTAELKPGDVVLIGQDGERIVPKEFAFKLASREIAVWGRKPFPPGRAKVKGSWTGEVTGIDVDVSASPITAVAKIRVIDSSLYVLPVPAPHPSLFDQPAEASETDLEKILEEHVATCEECRIASESVGPRSLAGRCERYMALLEEYGKRNAGEETDAEADEEEIQDATQEAAVQA